MVMLILPCTLWGCPLSHVKKASDHTTHCMAYCFQEKFGEDIEIVDKGEEFDAGDYFEVGEDGQMKLKDGQTKIDLSKLTEEDLLKLGIDPSTMTKEEISRKLRVCIKCRT